MNKIYEHLKTRKKYNTLEIKYQAKCEELDDRVIQLNTEKRIKKKSAHFWRGFLLFIK